MLQSIINDMFSVEKELNTCITIPQSVHSVPHTSSVKCLTIQQGKNPAYKNINSSQIIINKEIKVDNLK
jgi:hypothetical protein